MKNSIILGIASLAIAQGVLAQGQDSSPWERDRMVIAELLEGGYSNANQAYFDYRVDREQKHDRLDVEIVANDDGTFIVSGAYSGKANSFQWALALSSDNDARAVRMRLTAGNETCDYLWRREAAQLRATAENCAAELPTAWVLSEQQLWIAMTPASGGVFELHRVRRFKCYADIPGVGGGRDIPYDRYGEFEIHDQGDAVWFTTKDGRELGLSLLLVDWPINNYDGVFTRDSFVIYLSEKSDGERKELGYAFTVPEADRIGINLKWILAMCYITSNQHATPAL